MTHYYYYWDIDLCIDIYWKAGASCTIKKTSFLREDLEDREGCREETQWDILPTFARSKASPHYHDPQTPSPSKFPIHSTMHQ